MRQKVKSSSSFIEQAAILAAASLFVRFIGFLYRMPLTSLIGDEGNSFYSTGYTIYSFVLIVSSGALPAAVSKLVSERLALKQYRNAHEMFKLSMLAAAVTGAAGSAFMWFGSEWLAETFQYPEAVYAIRTLTPTVFIVAFMAVFRGYFQGMRNNIPTALSQVVEGLFNAVFSVWLAYVFFEEANIEKAAAGGTAGTGIGALAGCLVIAGLYALVSPRVSANAKRDRGIKDYESVKTQLNAILRTALPIIIGMSIFTIANFVDLIMIKQRLEEAGFPYDEILILNGQYNGKYVVLTTLPVSLSMAMATAIIPNLAESKALKDKGAIRNKINTALRLCMIISVPAAVGLGVLSDPILHLLFPNHFEGGYLLRYGVIGIIFLSYVQIVTGILQGTGKVNAPVIGAFVGMLVKIPLNYFLIANAGINIKGAVISTCCLYLAAAVVDTYLLYRHTGILPNAVKACAKPIASSVVMGAVCYVVYAFLMQLSNSNVLSAILSVLSGVVVYMYFMMLIKGFNREDFERFPMGGRLVKIFF